MKDYDYRNKILFKIKKRPNYHKKKLGLINQYK